MTSVNKRVKRNQYLPPSFSLFPQPSSRLPSARSLHGYTSLHPPLPLFLFLQYVITMFMNDVQCEPPLERTQKYELQLYGLAFFCPLILCVV